MSRIDQNLITDEHVIYRTKRHWSFLLLPIIATVFLFILFIPIIWLIMRILDRKFSEFALTDKRVIIHVGVISSRSIELMLNKIEVISVNQGLIERLLGSGTLIIGGTGGTKEVFPYIENPFEFRKQIQERLAK